MWSVSSVVWPTLSISIYSSTFCLVHFHPRRCSAVEIKSEIWRQVKCRNLSTIINYRKIITNTFQANNIIYKTVEAMAQRVCRSHYKRFSNQRVSYTHMKWPQKCVFYLRYKLCIMSSCDVLSLMYNTIV